jgi:hypothetical protein
MGQEELQETGCEMVHPTALWLSSSLSKKPIQQEEHEVFTLQYGWEAQTVSGLSRKLNLVQCEVH